MLVRGMDPYQNVTYPKHCEKYKKLSLHAYIILRPELESDLDSVHDTRRCCGMMVFTGGITYGVYAVTWKLFYCCRTFFDRDALVLL
jgi:hypothetical protein